MALPVLEAMAPVGKAAAAAAASGSPRRMAFVYIPNGVHIPDWTPRQTGSNFDFPRILKDLDPYKSDLLVLSGLTHDKARPNGDAGGDHARASAAFLTACQPRKTAGADIRAGISVDQVAAKQLGQSTRFPSLEIGCEVSKPAGNCDSGYSCAYSTNISWRNASTPMSKEINPRLVFDRLFSTGRPGETEESRVRRQRYEKSILDFVLDDARQLQSRLGATDRRKMDEYLTAVREVELRIERSEKMTRQIPKLDLPEGVPADYAEHIRLMTDMMVLAFQTDVTRVCTLVLANDGSEKAYPFIGVPEGHHHLSHHDNRAEYIEKIVKINQFHISQFAYLLNRLKSIREGGSTLLDQSMIVYGAGISDGNAHNHDNLPVILAGKGGGSLQTGRHIRYAFNTPMANLFLSMLDRVDVKLDRFGDSTGRLENLG